MNIYISKLALVAMFPAIVLFGWIGTSAQSKPVSGKPKTARKLRPKPYSKPVVETLAKPMQSPASAPVSIVNLAEPDFLSGEASVTVNPKQPTVI
ncbi:MAG: hypothetical protein ABI878_16080, partial [Acidobacteriota bacterium]